jgi:hypothetical protein
MGMFNFSVFYNFVCVPFVFSVAVYSFCNLLSFSKLFLFSPFASICNILVFFWEYFIELNALIFDILIYIIIILLLLFYYFVSVQIDRNFV